jgi:hypothetical protein
MATEKYINTGMSTAGPFDADRGQKAQPCNDLSYTKWRQQTQYKNRNNIVFVVKLLPLPQPPVRDRTDARTNPSAQRANQLRSVLARVYAVSIQNQITTTVP